MSGASVPDEPDSPQAARPMVAKANAKAAVVRIVRVRMAILTIARLPCPGSPPSGEAACPTGDDETPAQT
ncbi:hypothetical protein GCM10009557_37890 [Virgisporangium ochraceum]